MAEERLQKVMAHAGVASRRVSEEMITAGKVTVNGKLVTELGVKVDPDKDAIKVNGKLIKGREKSVYYMLHKPRGVITTASDERGRKTVLDILPKIDERVYPVGRLDYNSEGLVLLTNDGRLANKLMHPSFNVRKFYIVELKGEFSEEALETMRSGVKLDDGVTSPAYAELLSSEPRKSLLKLGIREGKNRQIRRMCAALGYDVTRLIRTQIGPIKLGNLGVGQCRQLTVQELGKLQQAVKRGAR